ncbi:hypothetical protein D3C83_06580 [compost metagenome]
MALGPERVPEHHRAGLEGDIELQALDALLDLAFGHARLRQSREVALYVGQEHRHADPGESFGDPLQRHRLAGAGRSGDQAMAVGELGQEAEIDPGSGDEQGFRHDGLA